MLSFHLGLQIPINITGSIFPPVVESGNFILFISLALHRRVLFSSKLLKKGKEELIIFSSTRKLSDSLPLSPPLLPRPSGQHLNSTFYLNRRMKFLFVLSLMLCYSSAQNTNDPSEYNYCTVEPPWVTTFRKRPPAPKRNTKTFPVEALHLVPLVNDHLLCATATTLFGSYGLMISTGFNLL